MKTELLHVFFSKQSKKLDHFIRLNVGHDEALKIYPRSINEINKHYLFLAWKDDEKYLYLVSTGKDDALIGQFRHEIIQSDLLEEDVTVARCDLCHENAAVIQELLPFTRPVPLGVQNSIGLGDRIGIAGPGHIRAIAGKTVRPIIAQQSIRELERTGRTPEDVMDAAVWAVLQEGYRDGFGSDADHLKTADDIDYMAAAGFTMFTFDPGDHVVNEADTMPLSGLERRAGAVDWQTLETSLDDLLGRYAGKTIRVSESFSLLPTREDTFRGIVKYGNVIAHAVKLHRHLKTKWPDLPTEVELSVDETDSPTTPFEHYLIAAELGRLGVELVSLAPRFIGDFEKGIDYKGDLKRFTEEYLKHLLIAELLGPYKLSLHSGSDKFSVYNVVGGIRDGHVHVKTAGTSYLEALHTIAVVEPGLFREILEFSRSLYDTEKKTYHVSAVLANVPASEDLADSDLPGLFEQNDARQVLHVTFGRVLTEKTPDGGMMFRARILDCLNNHEETHYDFLVKHFTRHIAPFEA